MTNFEPPEKTAPSGSGLLRLLLVVIFRLLLLGVGGGFAFISGVAIAHLYPAPKPKMPLLEKLLRQEVSQIVSDLTRWSPAASRNAYGPLTPLERQNLQGQLTQLQAELQILRDRTTLLETQLVGLSSQAPIETRLQVLWKQLDPNTDSWSARPPTFMVTLPSDILFPGDQTTLNRDRQVILDSIIREMPSDKGGLLVRISAHTDNVGDVLDNLQLSLQRAQTVKQYLAAALGDEYSWLAVAYGESSPLVGNDTDSKRQRNRRIEITID